MEYRQGKLKYADLIRQRSGEVYGFFFYIPLFFLLSFFGWLWEVGIYLVKDGEFVNRGVLFGPWLPVYGCGGIEYQRACLSARRALIRSGRLAVSLLRRSLSASALPENLEEGKGKEGAAAGLSDAASDFYRRCGPGGGFSEYGERYYDGKTCI